MSKYDILMRWILQTCQLVRIFRNLYGNQTQLRKYGKPSKKRISISMVNACIMCDICVCGVCVYSGIQVCSASHKK